MAEQSVCTLCPAGNQHRLGRRKTVIRLLVRPQLLALGGPKFAGYQPNEFPCAHILPAYSIVKPGRSQQVTTVNNPAGNNLPGLCKTL